MNMSPEEYSQQQALNRQQQLATMLMQQGQQQPQGQMVSGRYVAPSFFQYLTPLANTAASQYIGEKADTAQAKLAAAIRQNKNLSEQKISELAFGTPEVSTELAGPYMGNIPQPRAVSQEGVKPDLVGALREINTNPYGAGKDIKPLLFKQMMPDPTELERNYKAAKAQGYEGTITDYKNQLNKYQEAQIKIDEERLKNERARLRNEEARLADEGIGGYGGSGVTPKPAIPTINVGSPILANPPMQGAKPNVVPTNVPTASAAQGYDYFKPPPIPAGLTNKQAREYVYDQNKPLTGKPNDQVTGAINYQKSLDKIQGMLDTYKGPQLLDPNVRAEFKAAIKTAQLQGKEAFGLGVLNGPDLDILEQVVADPTAFNSFLKDRSTINRLYNNQREFTAEAIKTNYRSAQKPVPSNLREYVEIKPKDLANRKITPEQANSIQRPNSVDEQLWNFMTPAEKSLFKR